MTYILNNSIICTYVTIFLLCYLKYTYSYDYNTQLPSFPDQLNFTQSPQKKENVILIISDDLGIDFVKEYGLRLDPAPMPVLEKLIVNGLLFERMYSNPSCSPTRVTILTGRYGFRTGTRCAIDVRLKGGDPNGVHIDEYTIPRALEGMNIKKVAIGKWHMATKENGLDHNPNIMGFDHYSGMVGNYLSSYTNWRKTIDGKAFKTNKYATVDTRDDAIAWLKENQHDQFFLWLAFSAPHGPYHMPPHDLHSFGYLKKPTLIQKYHAMVESLDTVIGQILDSLDPEVYKRTNIIFSGDNGENGSLTPNGYFEKSKVKKSLFDGGCHIPFVVHGPRVAYPSTRSSALLNTVDIYATILDMLECPNKLKEGYISDSMSFLPVIEGYALSNGRKYRFAEQDTGRCTFEQNPKNNRGFTLANDYFKYWLMIDGEERLFDIIVDPHEKNNLMKNKGFNENSLWNSAYKELRVALINLLKTEDSIKIP